jgi:hypothetical protein
MVSCHYLDDIKRCLPLPGRDRGERGWLPRARADTASARPGINFDTNSIKQQTDGYVLFQDCVLNDDPVSPLRIDWYATSMHGVIRAAFAARTARAADLSAACAEGVAGHGSAHRELHIVRANRSGDDCTPNRHGGRRCWRCRSPRLYRRFEEAHRYSASYQEACAARRCSRCRINK